MSWVRLSISTRCITTSRCADTNWIGVSLGWLDPRSWKEMKLPTGANDLGTLLRWRHASASFWRVKFCWTLDTRTWSVLVCLSVGRHWPVRSKTVTFSKLSTNLAWRWISRRKIQRGVMIIFWSWPFWTNSCVMRPEKSWAKAGLKDPSAWTTWKMVQLYQGGFRLCKVPRLAWLMTLALVGWTI